VLDDVDDDDDDDDDDDNDDNDDNEYAYYYYCGRWVTRRCTSPTASSSTSSTPPSRQAPQGADPALMMRKQYTATSHV
jgi:hypothetical protein